MPNDSLASAELCYRTLFPAAELPQPVIPPGSTVSEMVAAMTRDRDLHDRILVRIDGADVAPAWWSRSRPRSWARVEITLLPSTCGSAAASG